MWPGIAPGDHLLVDPQAYCARPPLPGDVAVANHPYIRDTIVVKRISAVVDGRVHLSSDNPDEGTDSSTFGTLEFDALRGRVTSIIARS